MCVSTEHSIEMPTSEDQDVVQASDAARKTLGPLSGLLHAHLRARNTARRLGPMVLVSFGLVALIMVLLVAGFALSRTRARQIAEDPPIPSPDRKHARWRRAPRSRYDWEPVTRQLYRRWKNVPGPAEDREAMLAFLDTRAGVEAYVEPRTVIHPLSVVFVAGDGEWVRFELKEDTFLRELAKERGLQVIDATRFGYPERMRRYGAQPPG